MSLIALRVHITIGLGLLSAQTGAGPTETVDVALRAPTGKVVSELHFAANVEFYRPGLAAGVSRQRDDLARALDESGVRALRFPGGNAAYWYLSESRAASRSLCPSHVRSEPFVRLEELADFAREAGIKLIYELPCLFYLDGDSPRAMVPSTYSERLGYYDGRQIEEGVAYGVNIARRLLELGAPIAAWELGNEEFAHCAVEDYGAVVARYARALHQLDPGRPVIAVGMGKDWLDQLVPILREAGVLAWIDCFQVHYPFGNWPGPGAPERKADPEAFVGGDLKMERFLDGFQEKKRSLGLGDRRTWVTETTVMRHQLWDPHAVIATHAHALCYAWNWMTLLERPEVDAAVFHDLETSFFGILRYNVGFDPVTRHFMWLHQTEQPEALSPRFAEQYVVSPTGCANRLLAQLAGEELWTTNCAPSPTLRVLASDSRVVAVNRGEEPIQLRLPFAAATGEALIADELAACLPGSFRYMPQDVVPDDGHVIAEIPAWSVAAVRRG